MPTQRVLVNIPPGTPQGSIVQVSIGHEMIHARVPVDGVTQFYVDYDSTSHTEPIHNPMVQSNQRRVLVKIPPGSPSGSIVQVQVGDTIIQAKVPSEGLNEFYVKYNHSPIISPADSPMISSNILHSATSHHTLPTNSNNIISQQAPSHEKPLASGIDTMIGIGNLIVNDDEDNDDDYNDDEGISIGRVIVKTAKFLVNVIGYALTS